MEELTQTWWQALLARLYWRDAVWVDAIESDVVEMGHFTSAQKVYEMRPRRFAWILRPLMRFD